MDLFYGFNSFVEMFTLGFHSILWILSSIDTYFHIFLHFRLVIAVEIVW